MPHKKPKLTAKTDKKKFPRKFPPQLAVLHKTAPLTKDWIYETKFDGYRLLAFIKNGTVKLITRNGKDWTSKFPSIYKALKKWPSKTAIIDGELVALDKKGVSRFQLLQTSLEYKEKVKMCYYVFDLPYLEGDDLRKIPLEERKKLLKKNFRALSSSAVKLSKELKGDAKALLKKACSAGQEGIIGKRKKSVYHNKRTDDWMKLKCTHRQELVIGGYTDPEGSRDFFGSLLLGYYNKKGHLCYAGKVGTGFDRKALKDIYQKMKKYKQEKPAYHALPKIKELKQAHWLKPVLVGEIEFTEWTNDNRIRHPAFKGLRLDKKAKQVILEKAK